MATDAEQFLHHLGAAGGAFFIDFFEFSDFPKNRSFDPFFDSGGAGTVLDRSGMQKYPGGLNFQLWSLILKQFGEYRAGVSKIGTSKPRFFPRNNRFS